MSIGILVVLSFCKWDGAPCAYHGLYQVWMDCRHLKTQFRQIYMLFLIDLIRWSLWVLVHPVTSSKVMTRRAGMVYFRSALIF